MKAMRRMHWTPYRSGIVPFLRRFHPGRPQNPTIKGSYCQNSFQPTCSERLVLSLVLVAAAWARMFTRAERAEGRETAAFWKVCCMVQGFDPRYRQDGGGRNKLWGPT